MYHGIYGESVSDTMSLVSHQPNKTTLALSQTLCEIQQLICFKIANFTALSRGDPFGFSRKALRILVAKSFMDLTVKIL